MPVTCPHCSTRYVLPRALLGPGGARVRCPRCRVPFAVSPEGEAIAPPPAATPEAATNGAHGEAGAAPAIVHAAPPLAAMPEPAAVPEEEASRMLVAVATGAPAEPESAPHPETALDIARAVVDELAAHSGEAIAASRDAGKLFREFGPVLAEAFEFYRRRAGGAGADAAPFRIALKERWGVDLDPPHPAGRIS